MSLEDLQDAMCVQRMQSAHELLPVAKPFDMDGQQCWAGVGPMPDGWQGMTYDEQFRYPPCRRILWFNTTTNTLLWIILTEVSKDLETGRISREQKTSSLEASSADPRLSWFARQLEAAKQESRRAWREGVPDQIRGRRSSLTEEFYFNRQQDS